LTLFSCKADGGCGRGLFRSTACGFHVFPAPEPGKALPGGSWFTRNLRLGCDSTYFACISSSRMRYLFSSRLLCLEIVRVVCSSTALAGRLLKLESSGQTEFVIEVRRRRVVCAALIPPDGFVLAADSGCCFGTLLTRAAGRTRWRLAHDVIQLLIRCDMSVFTTCCGISLLVKIIEFGSFFWLDTPGMD